MKFIYFLWFLCLGVYADCQTANTAIGRVTYEFVHKTNLQTGYLHKEQMVLEYGNNISKYYSLTAKLQDSMMQQKFENAMRNGSTNIDLGMVVAANKETIFFNRITKQLQLVENYRNTYYLITDKGTLPKWEIQKNTKKIDAYDCQSAITNFRGRTYTAWFTTQIPISFGTWKLNGLPGLILEAYDANKEVQFNFRWLVQANNLGNIQLPANAIVTTEKDFDKMKLAYEQGAQNNSVAMSGMQIQISNVQLNGRKLNDTTFMQQNGNPIELKKNN